ncbi:LOW QUALITY PROTEIN: hypothetical protein JCM24511_10086 [Saitozyma sp. JCM 24511]|nr:LOW QUALITY PROTEIN: hypothetical protein JCM24511_10086 [Saitozyma sp. JCM 24511]
MSTHDDVIGVCLKDTTIKGIGMIVRASKFLTNALCAAADPSTWLPVSSPNYHRRRHHLDHLVFNNGSGSAPVFFDERKASIRRDPAKRKILAFKYIRTNGLKMPVTCVGADCATESLLQEEIYHVVATITKLINLPHQHARLVVGMRVYRTWGTCNA